MENNKENIDGNLLFKDILFCLDSMNSQRAFMADGNYILNLFVLIWYLTVYAGFTQLKTLKEKFKRFNKQNSGLRVLGEDIDMAKCLTDRYKYIFSCS